MKARYGRKLALEAILSSTETEDAIANVDLVTGPGADANQAEIEQLEADGVVKTAEDAPVTEPVEEGADVTGDAETPPVGEDGEPVDPDAPVVPETTPEDGEVPPAEGEPAAEVPEESVLDEEEQAVVAAENLVYIEGAELVNSPIVAAADQEEFFGEIAEDIGQREYVMDEALNTAQTLDTIANTIETSLPVGGLRPADVAPIQASVGTVLDYAGLETTPELSLGTESYTPSKRLGSTKLAMESIREQASKMWQRLSEFVIRMVNYVKQHLAAFFIATKANKLKLDKLKKATQHFNTTKFQAGVEWFEDKNVIRQLTFDTTHTDDTIETASLNFTNSIKALGGAATHAHNEVYKVVNGALEGTELKTRQNVLTAATLLGSSWHQAGANGLPGYEVPDPSLLLYLGNRLPRGRILAAFVPATGLGVNENIAVMAKAKIFIAEYGTFEEDKLTAWPYLETQAEVLAGIKALDGVNTMMDTLNSDLNAALAVKRKLISSLGKQNYRDAKDVTKEKGELSTQKLCAYLIRSLSSIMDTPIVRFNEAYATFFSAGSTYIRRSLARGL